MKKSIKKLRLNKKAVSNLNSLHVKGGLGPDSPGSGTLLTDDEHSCDPRESACEPCDTGWYCD